MIRAGHKRKLSSIQYQALGIITAVSVPTHIKAFRFGLFGNDVSGELDVVFLGVSFTDGQHGGHGAARRGEEKDVVRVDGGAHEGVGDVAPHAQGVDVGGPEDGAEHGALPGAVLDVEEVGVDPPRR